MADATRLLCIGGDSDGRLLDAFKVPPPPNMVLPRRRGPGEVYCWTEPDSKIRQEPYATETYFALPIRGRHKTYFIYVHESMDADMAIERLIRAYRPLAVNQEEAQ